MIAPAIERVTGRCPAMPPSNAERIARWQQIYRYFANHRAAPAVKGTKQ